MLTDSFELVVTVVTNEYFIAYVAGWFAVLVAGRILSLIRNL